MDYCSECGDIETEIKDAEYLFNEYGRVKCVVLKGVTVSHCSCGYSVTMPRMNDLFRLLASESADNVEMLVFRFAGGAWRKEYV